MRVFRHEQRLESKLFNGLPERNQVDVDEGGRKGPPKRTRQ